MIRILLIEDNDLDVELTRQALNLKGLDHELTRVDSREAFLKHLEQCEPDLILSDHGLESFDGFGALQLSKKVCPKVPFIFLSGGMSHADSELLMGEKGIHCILKQHLFKDLVPAIQRALPPRM